MAWFIGAAPQSSAATLIVTNLTDGPAGSLRQRITEAAPGDTIGFSVSGQVNLTNELPIAKNVTIVGPGAANLSLRGGASRAFNISPGVLANISGITIADAARLGANGGWTNSGGYGEGIPGPGESVEGGGILNHGTLELADCVIRNCKAIGGKGGFATNVVYAGGTAYGGGIMNTGTLNLTRCTLTGNSANGGQGGLSSADCGSGAVSGRLACGGGIANLGMLRLVACSLQTNTVTGGQGGDKATASCAAGPGADAAGGAIWSQAASPVELLNCTLNNNAASGGDGGRIWHGSYAGAVTGSGGAGSGGAIAGIQPTLLALTDCTLIANTARGGLAGSSAWGGAATGGGIACTNLLSLSACTLSGNVAQGGQGRYGGSAAGGNLHLAGIGTAVTHNSILAGGSATGGAGQGGSTGTGTGPEVAGAVTSLGHNLVSQSIGTSGWISSDVLDVDPQLGSLQDHGGWTHTMALNPGSPALDTGDDAILSSVSTDQRGGPRKSGAHVDIGAFEDSHTWMVVNLNSGGPGSLHQAIQAAPNNEAIRFADGLAGTIHVTNTIVFTNNRSVLGPATGITLSAGYSNRVFAVNAGAMVTLCNLTIRGGYFQGATNQYTGDGGIAFGGGIINQGNLTLCNCTITDNYIVGGDGEDGDAGWPAGGIGGRGLGGGIANVLTGVLTLENCTLALNYAYGGDGGWGWGNGAGGNGGEGEGGGIYNSASLTLRSCTFSGNWAAGGSGGTGWTSGNTGSAYGGGLRRDAGTISLVSTLLGGNYAWSPSGTGPDVAGTVSSAGFNLVGVTNGSVGWVSSDLRGNSTTPLNPLVGSLQNNGGPTPTMALQSGSPAIDKGLSTGLATDQRGLQRRADFPAIVNASGGDGSDIGAYELQLPVIDIGLRVREGANTIRIAAEPAGTLTSRLRIRKSGVTYGIVLVEPSDPPASHLRVKTAAGPKAWAKLP